MLLESHDVIDAAFGSHNLRSLAHAIVTAKELGVPPNGYEIQMLYGMAEPVRQAIIQNGQRVRVYLPVGELLPGISYLIRRLMENTSNTSFLRQTYAEKKDVDSLIKAPARPSKRRRCYAGAACSAADRSERVSQRAADRFFARQKIASVLPQALEEVRGEFQKPGTQAQQRLMVGVGESRRSRRKSSAGCALTASIKPKRTAIDNSGAIFSRVARHAGGGTGRDSCSKRPQIMRQEALGARGVGSF